MLETNAKLYKMKYPIYSSLKLEDDRRELTPMGLFTRPMKRFNNKLLESKFSKILKYCAEHGVTLEGVADQIGKPYDFFFKLALDDP